MITLFDHYVNGEKLYLMTVQGVCKKYELNYMEFTVIMFLANNPEFDTATEIVRYRHLTKSHVSMTVKSLQERKLIIGKHEEENHKTIHLRLTDKTADIVKDGKIAQKKFMDMLGKGFSKEEKSEFWGYIRRIDENIKNSMQIIN